MKMLLKNKSLLILIGILLIAGFLRFYRIDEYLTFLGDEGRDVLVVYNLLHGKLTLLGPTASVGGFFMGPFYYYLITPFLWLFNYNPVGPAVMVALFSLATICLLYKIGKEFFDEKTALIAASLYAISPLVIFYSRSSWNPNVMPFFTLLTMYVLYRAVKANNKWHFLATGVLFGFDIQLHYVELFLGVVIIAYVTLTRLVFIKEKLQSLSQIVRDGVWIFIGFIIGFSPFILFEIRHEFTNVRNIFYFIFSSGETGASSDFFTNISTSFFRLFGRLIFDFPPLENVSLQNDRGLLSIFIAILIFELICFFTLVKKYRDSFRNKEKFLQLSMVMLWLLLGIFFFGFYKKNIHDYYFEFLFPLPFLLIGMTLSGLYTSFPYALSFLLQKKSIRDVSALSLMGKISAITLFVVIVYLNINGTPIQHQPNGQMYQMKNTAGFVLGKTEGKPFNFALVAKGNSDHAYRYFFRVAGKDPVTIEPLYLDPERKTVMDQLLIICEDRPCQPLGHPLWEIAGFGSAEIAGQWTYMHVDVYRLVPNKEKKE